MGKHSVDRNGPNIRKHGENTATQIPAYTGCDITRHVGEMLALLPEWGVRDKFTQQDINIQNL